MAALVPVMLTTQTESKEEHQKVDDGTSSSCSDETFFETVESVNACQFTSWYPLFREYTFKSHVIPLPDPFVAYLRSDGIHLPRDGEDLPKGETEDDDDSDGAWSTAGDDAPTAQPPQFPELEKEISDTIEMLGGSAFPKLNWSSPKDAAWICATHTLKCESPTDVMLLLKGSDMITHDLHYPYENCRLAQPPAPTTTASEPAASTDLFSTQPHVPYVLVLRKYFALHHSNEFRCFVREGRLLAISQREATHFPHLKKSIGQLSDTIEKFWQAVVRTRFPIPSYVFDVYVSLNERVYIVDFGLWGPSTDPLLFDWDELRDPNFGENLPPDSDLTKTPGGAVVKLVTGRGEQEEGLRLPLGGAASATTANRYPLELLNLGLGGDLASFVEHCRSQRQSADDPRDDAEGEK
ncbi:putative cell division cycle protein [Paratrimastix pyriformis]|uniref:Cell division cycle protein n=1 Tax=Paratrimastix pyriformis TaxID=342808 RepID=A0ABQ8UMP7_9EUKA|nr:putative cell division cycle protein [Paratrimastix pyriformis]